MYLEMVFAWGMCLMLFSARHRKWTSRLTAIVLMVVGTGVLVTLTRAGLFSLFLLLAVIVLGAWWREGLQESARTATLLALVLGLVAAVIGGTSPLGIRLGSQPEREWYGVEYAVPVSLDVTAGELLDVEVSLSNTGSITWSSQGSHPIRLSYHWLDAASKEVVIFEGLRTNFNAEVRPGESVVIEARVQVPDQPGDYHVAWDMLQEELFWFAMQGVPMGSTRVSVRGGEALQESNPLPARDVDLPGKRFMISRLDLWRAALKLFSTSPLLGIGPDNFRLMYREALGLEVSDETYHTHNIFLEFFVGCGLAGGLVFLYLILRLVVACVVALLNSSPESGPFVLASAAAVTAIVMHGMVDSFFQFTPTYLMIWITFGLAIRIAELSRRQQHEDDLRGPSEK